MTDDDKKEIFSVNAFPESDLRHLMAGVPPDRDFSNAKPTNQVNANTFLLYIEPYVRPMMEEDIAFLKEKVRPPPHPNSCDMLTLSYRVTESRHLSCQSEERSITRMCGLKKTV